LTAIGVVQINVHQVTANSRLFLFRIGSGAKHTQYIRNFGLYGKPLHIQMSASRRFKSSGNLCCDVGTIVLDISKDSSASIFRVQQWDNLTSQQTAVRTSNVSYLLPVGFRCVPSTECWHVLAFCMCQREGHRWL